MLTLQVAKQLDQVSRLADQLSKKQLGRATSAAINRSLTHSKVLLKRALKQQYKLTEYDLKDFQIFKSTASTLTGKLGVRRTPISLAHFNPRFVHVSSSGNTSISVKKTKGGLTKVFKQSRAKNPAKGVSVEIKVGKRITIPYAFIPKNDSIKPVFARGEYKGGAGRYSFIKRTERINKSGSDTPITKLLSTSVAGATKNPAVQKTITVDVTDWFSKRLEHEIRHRISKL